MRRLLPRHRGARWALALLAAVVALNAIGYGLTALDPPPTGPASSSYATQPRGLRAWAELLEDAGHPVRRLREPPADRAPDPRQTVVVLDPGRLSGQDSAALVRFVERGGRLVAGGEGSGRLAGALAAARRAGGDRLTRGPAGVLAPVPEVAGVERVAVAGPGAWEDAGRAVPALGRGEGALLVVGERGAGRAALLADASPLHNRLLSRADNAELALALAGEPGRPVAVVESVHGFGPAGGLAALPGRWQGALLGRGLAALAWLAAHARRLGPAEEDGARPVPARAAYVAALARTLGRTRDPHAASAPVRGAARAAVARRAALAPDAGDGEIEAAARRLGLDEEEAAAVAGRAAGTEGALAVGRALARLRQTGAVGAGGGRHPGAAASMSDERSAA